MIPQNPGLIPSPYDKRDILTAEIVPEIKRFPKECPAPFDLDILDQNGYPACVGFAAAGMKQYLEARERIWKVFDGLWLYQECKKIDGIPDFPGTYLRAVLKVLQKKGAKPIGEPELEAEKYRIGGYAQVSPLTFEELKKMIFLYGVVLVGFTGSNEGWQTALIRPPKEGEKTWGHAIFLRSYLEFIDFQNSWKEIWGDKGIGHFDQNYLPFEAWVPLVDFPTNAQLLEIASGYVAKEFLKPEEYYPGQIAQVNTFWGLKLRTEPQGAKLKTLPDKTKVMVLEDKNLEVGGYHWVKVKI